jgi:hypothetical protein
MSNQAKTIQIFAFQGENKFPINPITNAKNVKVETDNVNLPEGTSNVQDVVRSLGALAFEDDIDIPEASTESYGLAMLSDDINDVSETGSSTAATTKAVSQVSVESVKVTGDQDVEGNKSFKDGIQVGNAKLTYTENAEEGTDVLTVDFV